MKLLIIILLLGFDYTASAGKEDEFKIDCLRLGEGFITQGLQQFKVHCKFSKKLAPFFKQFLEFVSDIKRNSKVLFNEVLFIAMNPRVLLEKTEQRRTENDVETVLELDKVDLILQRITLLNDAISYSNEWIDVRIKRLTKEKMKLRLNHINSDLIVAEYYFNSISWFITKELKLMKQLAKKGEWNSQEMKDAIKRIKNIGFNLFTSRINRVIKKTKLLTMHPLFLSANFLQNKRYKL